MWCGWRSCSAEATKMRDLIDSWRLFNHHITMAREKKSKKKMRRKYSLVRVVRVAASSSDTVTCDPRHQRGCATLPSIRSLLNKLNWNSSFFVFHSKSSKASCSLSFFFSVVRMLLVIVKNDVRCVSTDSHVRTDNKHGNKDRIVHTFAFTSSQDGTQKKWTTHGLG